MNARRVKDMCLWCDELWCVDHICENAPDYNCRFTFGKDGEGVALVRVPKEVLKPRKEKIVVADEMFDEMNVLNSCLSKKGAVSSGEQKVFDESPTPNSQHSANGLLQNQVHNFPTEGISNSTTSVIQAHQMFDKIPLPYFIREMAQSAKMEGDKASEFDHEQYIEYHFVEDEERTNGRNLFDEMCAPENESIPVTRLTTMMEHENAMMPALIKVRLKNTSWSLCSQHDYGMLCGHCIKTEYDGEVSIPRRSISFQRFDLNRLIVFVNVNIYTLQIPFVCSTFNLKLIGFDPGGNWCSLGVPCELDDGHKMIRLLANTLDPMHYIKVLLSTSRVSKYLDCILSITLEDKGVFKGKEVHSWGKLMELILWNVLDNKIELPSIQYILDYQSYRISLVNVVTCMSEDIVEAQIINHGMCSVHVVDNVNYELGGITIVECSPRLQDATYANKVREEIEEILMNTIGLPSLQCDHELPFLNHVTTEVFGHICPTDVVWFLPLDTPMMTLFVDIAPIFFLPLKYAHVQEVTIKRFKKQNDYPFVIMSVNYGTGESMLMLFWRLTLEDKGDFEGVRSDNDRLSVLLATQDSWRPIWDEMNFKIESQGEKEISENSQIFSQIHQFGHQQMKSNLTYKIFIAASNEFDSCFFVYDLSESCEIPVARFNCEMMVCSVHGGDHLGILISWAVQVFVAPINGFDVETEKWFSCIIANFHQAAFMIQRAILLDKYIRHHLISSCYTPVTRILSFAHLGGLSNSGKLDINSRDGTSDVSNMMLEPKKLSSWLFKENLRVAIKWYNKSVIIYIFDPGGSPMIRIIDASLYEYRLL